jgi:hypothetical protein
MSNAKKIKPQGNIIKDEKDVRPADQAEGERDGKTATKVKPTPGSAEGDRETVEEDIRIKEKQGKL